jgi:hypothetical protein
MNMSESIHAARLGDIERTADGLTVLQFRFAADQPVFAGHFPGHPILPGIFQLEMARVAAETVFNGAMRVREITKAKFRRPILPAETIRLELKLSTEVQGGTGHRPVLGGNLPPSSGSASESSIDESLRERSGRAGSPVTQASGLCHPDQRETIQARAVFTVDGQPAGETILQLMRAT